MTLAKHSTLVLATVLSAALTAEATAQVIQSGSQANVSSSNVVGTGPVGPAIIADDLGGPGKDMIFLTNVFPAQGGLLIVNGAPAPIGTYSVTVTPANPPVQPNATVAITYGPTSFINVTLPVQNTGPTHAGSGIDITNPTWVGLPGITYCSQGTSPNGGDIAFFNGTIWVNGAMKPLNGVNYLVNVNVTTLTPLLSVFSVTWHLPVPVTVQIMIL